MDDENRLGSFLRARRDRLTPHDAGLPVAGRRRVPGLRRDELAELAGVSVAYYVRLERGSDRHPSDQMLDALARALRLDDDARRHLHELVRPAPEPHPVPSRNLPDGIARVVTTWSGPATAGDDTGLVLAANELARALSHANAPGLNGYRALFLDPSMRSLYGQDWERVAEEVVAGLRAATGAAPTDERLVSLIHELSITSPEFRERWAHFEVRPRAGSGITRITHHLVGPMTLRYEKLAATGHPRIGIVLFSAGPDPADVDALERLRRLATDKTERATTTIDDESEHV